MTFLETVQGLWAKLKSNPYFVAAEGAFLGAIGDTIFDELQTGHIDTSATGWHKMLMAGVGSAAVAVRALYKPAPNAITIPVAPAASANPTQPLETSTVTKTSVEPAGSSSESATFPVKQ
jgi:hypothetical protein